MGGLDSIQKGAQDQFGRRGAQYGAGHILADVRDVEDAVGVLDLKVPSDVLDVAAGAGHTGLYLAGLGHRVVLGDITPRMLEEARKEAERRGLTVETQEHPAEELPFPSEAFDLVTCRVAGHHFSQPARFVEETARVLRPGGYLLVIDGTVDDGHPEAEQWLHEVEKTRDLSHERFLTPGSWRELCEAQGLRVIESRVSPFKQPDLDWYLDVAGTPPERRERIARLVREAPESARQLFHLQEVEGKTVWWWRRLTLVARKGSKRHAGLGKVRV